MILNPVIFLSDKKERLVYSLIMLEDLKQGWSRVQFKPLYKQEMLPHINKSLDSIGYGGLIRVVFSNISRVQYFGLSKHNDSWQKDCNKESIELISSYSGDFARFNYVFSI